MIKLTITEKQGETERGLLKFTVEETPSTYPITVSATGKAKEDITVSIKVDNSLVEKYNADNKTSYYATPEGAVALEKSQVVIEKGKATSDISLLSVVSADEFVDGRIYIIPVTITDVKGGLEVLESSRTIYLRISRVVYFTSLDMNNTNLYSNFIFEDSQKMDLPTYTYEIKDDEITFTFETKDDDIKSGTFAFEETEDGIKIGLVEYKKA